jgi:hypothetical protein
MLERLDLGPHGQPKRRIEIGERFVEEEELRLLGSSETAEKFLHSGLSYRLHLGPIDIENGEDVGSSR